MPKMGQQGQVREGLFVHTRMSHHSLTQQEGDKGMLWGLFLIRVFIPFMGCTFQTQSAPKGLGLMPPHQYSVPSRLQQD